MGGYPIGAMKGHTVANLKRSRAKLQKMYTTFTIKLSSFDDLYTGLRKNVMSKHFWQVRDPKLQFLCPKIQASIQVEMKRSLNYPRFLYLNAY